MIEIFQIIIDYTYNTGIFIKDVVYWTGGSLWSVTAWTSCLIKDTTLWTLYGCKDITVNSVLFCLGISKTISTKFVGYTFWTAAMLKDVSINTMFFFKNTSISLWKDYLLPFAMETRPQIPFAQSLEGLIWFKEGLESIFGNKVDEKVDTLLYRIFDFHKISYVTFKNVDFDFYKAYYGDLYFYKDHLRNLNRDVVAHINTFLSMYDRTYSAAFVESTMNNNQLNLEIQGMLRHLEELNKLIDEHINRIKRMHCRELEYLRIRLKQDVAFLMQLTTELTTGRTYEINDLYRKIMVIRGNFDFINWPAESQTVDWTWEDWEIFIERQLRRRQDVFWRRFYDCLFEIKENQRKRFGSVYEQSDSEDEFFE